MKIVKQIFSGFLLILFLIGAIQVNVNAHYCKGRLAKISVWDKVDPCCKKENGQTQIENNCCSSAEFSLAFEDEFQKNQSNFTQELQIVFHEYDEIGLQHSDAIKLSIITDRAPPNPKRKLYLLNQSLKLCA